MIVDFTFFITLQDDNNYYTVPSSLNIFECFKDKDVPEPWKVFVLCLFREDMKVDGTQIIYRVCYKLYLSLYRSQLN